MKGYIKVAAIFGALICFGCGSDDEEMECQICHIDYTYEYTDTDPNGNPVTVTENGRESTDEACGSSQDLIQMEATVQGDAVSFEVDLVSQGAQNITTNVVCEKTN